MKTTSAFLTQLFENHCQWLENEGEDNPSSSSYVAGLDLEAIVQSFHEAVDNDRKQTALQEATNRAVDSVAQRVKDRKRAKQAALQEATNRAVDSVAKQRKEAALKEATNRAVDSVAQRVKDRRRKKQAALKEVTSNAVDEVAQRYKATRKKDKRSQRQILNELGEMNIDKDGDKVIDLTIEYIDICLGK